MWVYPGGHLLGEQWAYLNIFYVLSSQKGSNTSQVHLDASSCPSWILLMALSPINKTCSWLLDAACLPGMLFHPTLLYNMHEDFWHAYRAPQWITNGRVFVKHTVATFSTPLTWVTSVTREEAGLSGQVPNKTTYTEIRNWLLSLLGCPIFI